MVRPLLVQDRHATQYVLAPPQVDLEEDEITRAIELMESMSTDDISEYRDWYQAALEKLIEAKLEGREPEQPKEGQEQPGDGRVVDLMAALEESSALLPDLRHLRRRS